MKIAVVDDERPARKEPCCDPVSVLRTFHQVITATSSVKPTKLKICNEFIS